jgi:hypothetical protein
MRLTKSAQLWPEGPAPAAKNAALPNDDGMQRHAFALGREYALPFLGFVLMVCESARRDEIGRLFFFSREGVFFKRLFDSFGRSGLAGRALPAASILMVSRLSTFAPSLADFGPDELMRLWRLYSAQSPKAFFRSLNAYDDRIRQWIGDAGIDEDRLIETPWQDRDFCHLLASPRVQAHLHDACSLDRELVRTYLRDNGWQADARIGIVDIGWRGTIQDNICALLPDVRTRGYYLGLQKFLNPQPANATKSAFLADANAGEAIDAEILRFVSPIEMLCNSLGGTVTAYRRTSQGVVPRLEENGAEDRVWKEFSGSFQAGVESRAPEFATLVQERGWHAADIRPRCRDVMLRFLDDPPLPASAAYFELSHNETFGLGKFVERTTAGFPVWKRRLSWMVPSWRRDYRMFLASTGWPGAYRCLVRRGCRP